MKSLKRISLILLVSLLLGACGGGGSGSSTTASTTSGSSSTTTSSGGTSSGGSSGGTTTTDTTPPTVTGTSSRLNVAINTSITATFSEPVNCTTVTTSTFKITGVTGTVTCSNATATFTPSGNFAYDTTYNVSITGGSGGVKDLAGNALSTNYTWLFTTVSAAPPPSAGATEIPTVAGASDLFRYPYLLTDSSRRMQIEWATASSGTCEVQYKASTDTTWSTQSTCSEQTFTTAATGMSANFYQHEAVLDNLQPNTSYTYNVIHNGVVLAKNVTFSTMKEDVNATTQFIVFGDSGVEYSTPRNIRDAIASKDANGNYIYPHDFIVGVGDIAYYNGTYQEFDRNFFGQLSGKIDRTDGLNSILSTRAFFPVLGNHEYGQSSTNIPSGYLASFSLPIPAGVPSQDAERYYSFDSGNAHFVVIDSEKFEGDTTATRLAQMLSWLDADLAATTKTWRMVFLHRAIFSSANHGTWGDTQQNDRMRRQLAPILQNRSVQLVMFGHDHAYQRSKRLRVDGNGKIIRDGSQNVVDSSAGIVYVLSGIGGADLHNCQADPNALFGSSKYNYYYAQYGDGYDFVASRNGAPVLFSGGGSECTGLPTAPATADRFGFVHVTISGSTLSATTYNYNGVVMDQFSMSAN